MLTDTKNSPYAKVSPLPWSAVEWTEGFWADVFTSNMNNTIPHLQKMFEAKEISHVVENFRICAGETEGDFEGTTFGDGDFYKWMEAALYSAAKSNEQKLFSQVEYYIDLIERSQLSDGYIATKKIINELKGKTDHTCFGDINDFETYNWGHLFTVACLHKRITGKDNFLKVAEKAAGYLEQFCLKGIESGEVQSTVCPSHYMGLMELYRTTQNRKYLELAKLAIDMRDSVKNGMDDNQDRIPLKQHKKIIGHAVRANYLYAGLADLCLETGDTGYLDVLHKVWSNLVNNKLYVTGGCGALYNGVSPYGKFGEQQLIHQAYGNEYQLPNITAYNETCASVGSVLWAYRMFQLNPRAEYFDLIERTMLNVNLAAVSIDGKKFFYENMLRRAKALPYELMWPLTRSEYLFNYCCPPNLARTIAESTEYAYLVSENAFWTGMYGANNVSVTLHNGTSFTLRQETKYPYDGKILFTVGHLKNGAFTLQLRIPGWVQKGYISSEDISIEITVEKAGTYVPVEITHDTTIVLDLDMPVRYTMSHPLVEENTNQVAVERGPLVYCIEDVDSSLMSLSDLILDPKEELKPVSFEIKGRSMFALEGEAYEICRGENYHTMELYQTLCYTGLKKTHIRMIPYFAWDNREYGEMKIWLPVMYR